MSAAADIANALGISEQERLDMFAVYLSLPDVHQRLDFEEAIADPAMRICLKNVAHARRQAIARRKANSANDAARFELTP